MNRILIYIAFLSLTLSSVAQTDWKKTDKLMEDASYKSAYAQAESVYRRTKNSTELLTAAWYMARAAAEYQEDAHDSAVARYRAILPRLEAVDRAVCYAFMGVNDSALMDEELLKKTSSERFQRFCGEKTKGVNLTPTAYDVVAQTILARDYRNVALLERLIDFHRADDDLIRMYLDLEMMERQGYKPNGKPVERSLQEYINKYRGSSCQLLTQFYYRMAEFLNGKGRKVEAVRYCDTAVALFPKSSGGADCANLRGTICRAYIGFSCREGEETTYPGRPSLHKLSYTNLSRIHFALYAYDGGDLDRMMKRLPKPLREWQVEVEDDGSHVSKDLLFDVPALEAGRYLLVASPDGKFDREDAYLTLHCIDFALSFSSDGEFLMVDALTGAPIEGQDVILLDYNNTLVTYPDGRFRMPYHGGRQIRIERGGAVFEQHTWYFNQGNNGRKFKSDAQSFSDRPIYRPGDTVHYASLLYSSDGVDGRVLGGRGVTLKLRDPNGKERDRRALLADAHGVVSATFVIPADGLAGQWAVVLSSGGINRWHYLRVEEYKQPKFMVTLGVGCGEQRVESAPQFGQPYTVHGLAQAYSGVNISGAKVKYTVSRITSWYRWYGGEGTDLSFSDSTVTAADGSFEITFTPMPDSSVDFTRKPYFIYTLRAEVTDLNGETHDATASLSIGFTNERLSLAASCQLPTVNFTYSDLNGNPLRGDVTLKVQRLHRPDTVRLTPEIISNNPGAAKTLGREDFRRLFPHYTYSAFENNPDYWTTDWEHVVVHHADGLQQSNTIDLQGVELHSGVYRIIASAGEVTDTQYTTLVLPAERFLPTTDLLWSEVSGTRVEVGDSVILRYASAFDSTRLFFLLTGPDGNEIDSRWLIAARQIQTLAIPVDSSMLGGIQLTILTVREGVRKERHHSVDVPFTHKRLDVDITTFRDKLLPGEQEEWTVRVTELQSEKVTKLSDHSATQSLSHSATLIMTMYDDALNSYNNYRYGWRLSPWRTARYHSTNWMYADCNTGDYYSPYTFQNYNDPDFYALLLADGLFDHYFGYRGRRLYKNSMPQMATVSDVVVEEDEYELSADAMDVSTARGESGMVTMQGNVRKSAAAKDEEIYTVVEEAVEAPTPEVQLRSNLGTLAFFVSDLRTDSNGTATYRFRVPELLTRWNVRGMAFTDDLKIGTLDRTLVTSKPLMVQPNIPRFLRHGDSLVMMAKVVLSNPEDLKDHKDVRVTFLLTDAATGDTLCHLSATQPLSQSATQVTFPLRVPRNVYVVTYQIVASTDGMSDGERGQIPVVSDRQAVTLSQPLYINGVGEKTYHFPSITNNHSPITDPDTRQPLLLGAELVDDPIWLAVKSMPYLQQTENPSNLYLANRLYVNTLAHGILKKLPTIHYPLPALSDTSNTRLRINEDVKQTLLQATPWLRDAEAEVEQRRAIANYFDSTRMAGEFERLQAQLSSRQNSDGGWSWMPDGQSSLWVTEQILKKLITHHSSLITENALAFIDREEQRHYEKYIKPYLKKGYKWTPDNIDYLYTRSFYGKANTEAYKFYYSNALKNYKNYTGLYTQAQLALIFQRHGDKTAARDLIRRLKEKSLESDEMGLYWRDNRSGWCWYERPIETQALLIQAFCEVTPQDTLSIALMQQWLLKQKQTTHWGNDRATVEAIQALMVSGYGSEVIDPAAGQPRQPSITNNHSPITTLNVCGAELSAPLEGLEGYRTQRWQGPALDSIISLGDSTITLRKETPGIAWGAVYYQYTDDMDKIPASESGITLKRSYVRVTELLSDKVTKSSNHSATQSPSHSATFTVGDRVRIRIEISCDRNMEYLELIDGRPSCVEPLSTRAGWCWNQGLRYYVEVKNTATHCYIDRLEKGKYVVEYDVYVTNPGAFLAGPVTMQCMYAPEFRATAPAQKITVQ